MAFNRKMELIVGYSTVFLAGLGVDVADLEMTFDVKRSITFSENTAIFTIKNASENTRNMIEQEKSNIIFKAGYEDEGVGTLFIGQVTEVESIKTGAEWMTTIRASAVQSPEKPLDYTTLSLSFAPKTLLSTILQQLGTALGVVVSGAENAEIELPNGWVYAGTIRGALEYCLAVITDNNGGLYIDNNELVIYKVGQEDSRYSVVYLDYESGLKSISYITENTSTNKVDQEGLKETDKKRIQFETIMIPKIQPNGLMQVKTDKIEGTFLIESLHFTGGNLGGDFGVKGEAVA